MRGVVVAVAMLAAMPAQAEVRYCGWPPGPTGKAFHAYVDARNYIEDGRWMTLEKRPRGFLRDAKCERAPLGVICDGQEQAHCFKEVAGVIRAVRSPRQ